MNGAPTWGGITMEQANLVHPSAFCWNPHCTDYGKVDHGNIRRFGRTQAGTQRYQCRTCGGTFVETIGTVFYGRHHSQATIMDWLRIAADHVERIEALLLANFHLERAQLDAMWTYVGHKGEKGGAKRRTNVAPSGAASPSTAIRVYESAGRSRRPRSRSPMP